MQPPIPDDVLGWLRNTFETCNARIAGKVSRIPTVHETSLDLTFVEFLSQVSAPVRLPSDWVVRLDVHYLGGMRHWGSWEIADIGVLFLLRHKGKVINAKIALLQSKRLYPEEQDFEEDRPIDYQIGFGRLWKSDENFLKVTAPREFHFRRDCRYKALLLGDEQFEAIKNYEREYSIPVHYSLYHPLRIPSAQRFPLVAQRPPNRVCKVGCRVVRVATLRDALKTKPKGYAPSYGELCRLLPSPFDQKENHAGWPLETFIVDLLIGCREGYRVQGSGDPGVNRVFAQRGAPISAAVSISIYAPKQWG
jgi:hypothetical protein